MPKFNDYKNGFIEINRGSFKINADKNEIYLSGCGTDDSIPIGTEFIYFVE